MATEDDANKIIARIKGLSFGANLTSELVKEFIDEEREIIDGILSNLYETPITMAKSPKSFRIVETCVTHRVLKRIELFLKTSTGVEKTSQAVTDYMKRNDEAKMLTEGIMNGKINLTDAIKIGTRTYSKAGTIPYSVGRYDW